jgi:hypothetical protein
LPWETLDGLLWPFLKRVVNLDIYATGEVEGFLLDNIRNLLKKICDE